MQAVYQQARRLIGLAMLLLIVSSPVASASEGDETVATQPVPGAEAVPDEGAPNPPEETLAVPQPAKPVADVTPSTHAYQSIVSRNSFGLKDPPPPPPPPTDAPPPVNTSALKLTCITTLLGKRAMFLLQDPKSNTNKVSDLLREGERDSSITNLEVLQIDDKAGVVRVVFGGQEMAMNFNDHGLRAPTNMVMAAALPGAPRVSPIQAIPPPLSPPTAVGVPPPMPGGIQAGRTTFEAGGNTRLRTVPTRPSRLGNTAIPVGGGVNVSGTLPEAQAPQVSEAQQQYLMQEQQKMARDANIELPPMPPGLGIDMGPPPLPNQ